MALRVCALLIPRQPTPRICVELTATLRATLTEKYPGLEIPVSDIALVEQILAGLVDHQKSNTINKKHTTQVGSLIGGN